MSNLNTRGLSLWRLGKPIEPIKMLVDPHLREDDMHGILSVVNSLQDDDAQRHEVPTSYLKAKRPHTPYIRRKNGSASLQTKDERIKLKQTTNYFLLTTASCNLKPVTYNLLNEQTSRIYASCQA